MKFLPLAFLMIFAGCSTNPVKPPRMCIQETIRDVGCVVHYGTLEGYREEGNQMFQICCENQ